MVFVLFTITKKGQFKACHEEHMRDVRWPKFCSGPGPLYGIVWEQRLDWRPAVQSKSAFTLRKTMQPNNTFWTWEVQKVARLRQHKKPPTSHPPFCLFSATIFNTCLQPCGGSGNFPTQGKAVRPVATRPRMHRRNIQTLATLVFPQKR